MLKGQAKKNYQREYMKNWQRKRRGSKQGLNIPEYVVRPAIIMPKPVILPSVTTTDATSEAWVDADGNPVYIDN